MSKLKCPHCGGDVYPGAGLPSGRQRQQWDENREHELAIRKRNKHIAETYAPGTLSYEQLGNKIGLSREQVRIAIVHAEQEAERETRYNECLSVIKSIGDMPLDALDLPARMSTDRFWFGKSPPRQLKFVGELLKIPDEELLTSGNLGRATLYRWKQCLAELATDFARVAAKRE
jgi:hypothetical protein